MSDGDDPSGVLIGDFDLDGNNDIVVANAGQHSTDISNVGILFAMGGGAFAPPRVFDGFSGPVRTVAGDIDQDGWPDLAVTDFDADGVTVLFGSPTGVFDGTRTLQLTVGQEPVGLDLVDLNEDGWLDLAVVNSGDGNLSLFLNDRIGGLNVPTVIDVQSQPFEITSGDFDEDGCPDLVVTSNGNTSLSLLLGFCDGSFAPQTEVPVGFRTRRIATGDFDANGTMDLAVIVGPHLTSDDLAEVVVLFGDGRGTFPTQEAIAAPNALGVAVADIDGDGIDDIAATSSSDIRVILSNRDGSFDAETFQAGNNPNQVALGDLDGDQDIDIAVSNLTNPGSITLLMNRCGD